MTIHLIGCGKKKRSVASKAIDLYIGTTFLCNRKIHEARYSHLPGYILSAKYGIVSFDKVIEPYDLAVDDLDERELENLAQRVSNKLRRLGVSRIIAGYPLRYDEAVRRVEGIRIRRPYSLAIDKLYPYAASLRVPTHRSIL